MEKSKVTKARWADGRTGRKRKEALSEIREPTKRENKSVTGRGSRKKWGSGFRVWKGVFPDTSLIFGLALHWEKQRVLPAGNASIVPYQRLSTRFQYQHHHNNLKRRRLKISTTGGSRILGMSYRFHGRPVRPWPRPRQLFPALRGEPCPQLQQPHGEGAPSLHLTNAEDSVRHVSSQLLRGWVAPRLGVRGVRMPASNKQG